MVKANIKIPVVELDGDVTTVLSEISLALFIVCRDGIFKSSEGYRQEEAEAAIIATLKATRGWMNRLEGKNVDLKKIGEAIMKTE